MNIQFYGPKKYKNHLIQYVQYIGTLMVAQCCNLLLLWDKDSRDIHGYWLASHKSLSDQWISVHFMPKAVDTPFIAAGLVILPPLVCFLDQTIPTSNDCADWQGPMVRSHVFTFHARKRLYFIKR